MLSGPKAAEATYFYEHLNFEVEMLIKFIKITKT